MELYRELYHKLFAAAADAVDALENNEPISAKKRLIAAMREAEERVISDEGEEKCGVNPMYESNTMG